MSAPIQSWHTIPTAPDTTLHVLTSIPTTGSANTNPTLLFVHFWGGSPRTYSALAARLAPDFPLVLPALRGWGASTGPADPSAYGAAASAADLAALVAHLQSNASAGRFFEHGLVVVGHSMGAKIAQVLAARGALRGLLRGLILLGPAPLGRLELPPDVRAQQRAAYASRDAAEQVLRHVVLGSDVGADELRALVDDSMRGSEHARMAWPEYGMQEDYEGLVADGGAEGLRIPVAVVVGGVDKIEPAERVDEKVVQVLRKAGASVKMTVLDGVGHLIPVEAPTEVEDII
ncbi:Alpha/Beta hydrolase protein, partial [Mycena latifolia]